MLNKDNWRLHEVFSPNSTAGNEWFKAFPMIKFYKILYIYKFGGLKITDSSIFNELFLNTFIPLAFTTSYVGESHNLIIYVNV